RCEDSYPSPLMRSRCFSGSGGTTTRAPRTILMIATSLLALCLLPVTLAGYWPGWRGDGSGLSVETRLPRGWSATDNVLWQTRIPGEGLSSPIVWNDRVFLTAATSGPQWNRTAQVILAFLGILAPVVLGFYLTDLGLPPGLSASRLRRLPCTIWLVLTFSAVAGLTLLALQKVHAQFTALSGELSGQPWHQDSEYSRGVPGDWFIAGFLAAATVVSMRAVLSGLPLQPASLTGPKPGLTVIGLLSWLQCLCIPALAITFLVGKNRIFGIFLLTFAGCRLLQFLAERPHRGTATAELLPDASRSSLLSWFQSVYTLGMAGTFLIGICIYAVDNPLFPPVPTWFQVGDISSLGLIAAVGCLHSRPKLRMLLTAIVVTGMTLWALPLFFTQPLDEWWQSVRQARFEVHWALTLTSCLWFLLDRRPRERTAEGKSGLRLGDAGTSLAVSLAVILFAVVSALFPPTTIFCRDVLCLDQETGAIR